MVNKRYSIFNPAILLILFISLFPSLLSAQGLTLKGTIIDKDMRETLPFCNIYIPQIKEGMVANENGEFTIHLNKKVDSISFSYLGYQNYILHLPVNEPQNLLIEMSEVSSELQQIVIYAPRKRQKDTTAWRIYHNVVKNKPLNKPSVHDFFEYVEYSKTVGSFYNFSPKLLQRKIIRPFKFVLENYDTTQNGKTFIPLILKEDIIHHYYRKEPKKERKVYVSQKVSGIEQARISALLDIALDEMDAYGNELLVGGSSFMLPFADGAWFKYRFYVIDSAKNADSVWVYHLGFSPKNKGGLAFLGEAWIHAPTYAIQKIQLSIENDANINWIKDFSAEQQFKLIDNKYWVLSEDTRTTGIQISLLRPKKNKMVHLKQVKMYSDFKIDQPIADSILDNKRLYEKNYRKRSDIYWDSTRLEPLSRSEKNVYFLIDSLTHTRAYKVYANIGRALTSGYFRAGPIDIGNLYTMFSSNPVEGFRYHLSLRSNWKMSKKFYYSLYGAYGFKDKKLKYGGELKYRFPNANYLFNELRVSYTSDFQRFALDNISNNEHDFIYNTLFRRGNINDLVFIKDLGIYHEKEWNAVFDTKISMNYRQYKTSSSLSEFTSTQPDGSKKVIEDFNLFFPTFELNITPGAKFLRTEDRRIYIKGKLPQISIDYSFSKKGFLGSEFNYHKLGLNIFQLLPNPIGQTKLTLSAGKLFGKIPYPLLFIHPGNQTFLVNYRKFANMNEGQYVADQQVSFMLEHDFQGFFLNRIPFLRKAKLRELFIYKMAFSSLDKKKLSYIDMPADMKGLNGFYSEIGFGVGNILKLLELQFTWRLTQRQDPTTDRFAVKVWISPKF